MDNLFKTIFNSINDGIVAYGCDGCFLEVNPLTCQYLGYSKDELLQMNVLDLIPPEFRDVASKQIIDILRKNSEITEVIFRCKDGSLLPVKLNIQSIEYNEDQINLAVIRTITGHELSEMKLEESCEHLMLAVKGSNDGIWDWDLYNNDLYFSSRCKEMLGYEDCELLNVFSIIGVSIHPNDKIRVKDELKKYISEDLPEFKIEFRAKHRNGNYIWVLIRGVALRDEKGIAYRMSGSITDITKRKQIEIQFYEEALRRRVMMEQSNEGIVVINHEGGVFEANQKYAEMLGYSLEEVFQLHVWDWDLQFPREKYISMLQRSAFTNRRFETCHKRKDGTFFDVEISSNLVNIGNEKLGFCICRDITKRKQEERKLLNAKQEAESSSIAKSQFIANMSHELRTPLTSIIGFSDILQEEMVGELNEKQFAYVKNINKSGKQLLNIINDILDISKIEAGNIDVEYDRFSLQALFNEIFAVMIPIASKKHVSIDFENNVHDDEIIVDETKFKQILFNLLGNAIKFTNDGGMITVLAEKSYTDIEISVSDTGIGISNTRLKDIFNPFTQVDSSDTRRYGGTGLGLAIVKQLVELHRGVIWVESKEGEGSKFKFTIPINRK